MTPLETLQKYGLKTDVKSIIDRIKRMDYPAERDAQEKRMYDADLALLCSLAEKGERWERAYSEVRDEVLHSNDTYEVNDVLDIIDGIFDEGEQK